MAEWRVRRLGFSQESAALEKIERRACEKAGKHELCAERGKRAAG